MYCFQDQFEVPLIFGLIDVKFRTFCLESLTITEYASDVFGSTLIRASLSILISYSLLVISFSNFVSGCMLFTRSMKIGGGLDK